MRWISAPAAYIENPPQNRQVASQGQPIEIRHDSASHAHRFSLLALDPWRDSWRARRRYRRGRPGFACAPRLPAGMAFSRRRHRVGRDRRDRSCARTGGGGGRHHQGAARSSMACLRISLRCQAITSRFCRAGMGAAQHPAAEPARSRKAASSPGHEISSDAARGTERRLAEIFDGAPIEPHW